MQTSTSESMPLVTVLLVAAFGALGVLVRFGLGELAIARFRHPELMTALINVAGCALIAVVHVLLTQGSGGAAWLRPALMVGFLGGFTTFSAYALDTLRISDRGENSLALAYAIGSPIVGIAAAFVSVKMLA